MVLVFLILGLLLLLGIVLYAVLLSNVKLNIIKLHIIKQSGPLTIEFKSKMVIDLFGKIPIFSILIDDEKMKQLYSRGKINIKKLKEHQPWNRDTLKMIKTYPATIEQLELHGYIGTEDAALTPFITAFLNSIIPLFLSHQKNPYQKRHYDYNVEAVYLNQNIVNLQLRCIISLKTVHIITIVYHFLKKERGNKYERTSNRRTYAYSHE